MRKYCRFLPLKKWLRGGSDSMSFDYLLHSFVVKGHLLIKDKLL
jgi:hypothetical protein